ncbi:hypothetical protein GOBAR_AA29231 [Gossypium barbadense]|uniref:Uncharacterized protein n=1 Tax=Gossypium barbadense TaxID=3634 RepID=A0A2P5WK48_GOSBA|nr:hypothetical protein GOBAR_AA29231 [Gossypium barbadense]
MGELSSRHLVENVTGLTIPLTGLTRLLLLTPLSQREVIDMQLLQECELVVGRNRLKLERVSYSAGENNDNRLSHQRPDKQPIFPEGESPALSLVPMKTFSKSDSPINPLSLPLVFSDPPVKFANVENPLAIASAPLPTDSDNPF